MFWGTLLTFEFYDLSDSVASWFSDYLESSLSQIRPLKHQSGVAQGSIVGPTLFLLYINDLMLHANSFEPIIFADDTNLFAKSKDLNCL